MSPTNSEQVMHMVISKPKNILHDLNKNKYSLIYSLLAICVYVLISSIIIKFFQVDWSFGKRLYFTIINTTTVGFGDIVPTTHGGKVIACINAISGLIFFGLFISLLTLAFQPDSYSLKMEAKDSNINIEKTQKSKEDRIAEGLVYLSEILSNTDNNKTINAKHTRIYIHSSNNNSINIDIVMHIDTNLSN